jgi:hypothetical protein
LLGVGWTNFIGVLQKGQNRFSGSFQGAEPLQRLFPEGAGAGLPQKNVDPATQAGSRRC